MLIVVMRKIKYKKKCNKLFKHYSILNLGCILDQHLLLLLEHTPFDKMNEIIFSKNRYSCGSGDNFATKKVNMEIC